MRKITAMTFALITCILSSALASAADPPPLHVLVTGRGAGPGSIEEMWRPLVEQSGTRISVAFTMHVNSYYADHGNERAAGILPKDQEELMIALLLPSEGEHDGSPLQKEGERPVGVAIIGASSSPGRPGHEIIRNIQANKYGGRVHLVNPKGGEILGLPVTTSIDELPNGIDQAVVIVPAAATTDAVRRLAAKGVGTFVLAAGGYS